jgi:uncharacterized membrane protein YeaQ/YmgE (transglycosylase-associated protein family)
MGALGLVLLDVPNIQIIPDNAAMNLIFRQSWLAISLFGVPPNGYRVTFIGLIILIILALTVNAITEKLTSKKVGGLLFALFITILGSAFTAAYLLLPFDFAIEGVRIIAALLGAVIISVFWVLIRGAFGGGGK